MGQTQGRRSTTRPATTAEVERVLRFLTEYASAAEETFASVVAVPEDAPSALAEAAAAAGQGQGKGRGRNKQRRQALAANANPANPDPTKPQPVVPANSAANDQTDAPAQDEVFQPADARTAAWAGFCQALFSSAEFLFLR